jgi:outer membrane protein assembly factor BamB
MKTFWLIAALIVVGGCSSVGDSSVAPAALVDIKDPVEVERVWTRKVGKGSQGLSLQLAPAISNGVVYAADRKGVVEAFDAQTGKPKWSVTLKTPLSSGPAVSGDYLFVGGADGQLIALSSQEGTEQWRSPLSSEVSGRPVVELNTLIVRTLDEHVYALEVNSGKRIWGYAETSPALSLRGSGSPIVINGRVVVGFDNGKLLALNMSDGIPVWSLNLAVPRGRTDLERLVDVDATPLVVDGALYAAAYRGKVAAIAPDDGRVIWDREMSVNTGMVADAETLYVVDQASTLWAVALSDGAVRWQQAQLAYRTITAPASSGSFLYVGDFQGYVHVIDKAVGKIVGRKKLDKQGLAAVPTVEGENVYFLGRSGLLSAVTVQR